MTFDNGQAIPSPVPDGVRSPSYDREVRRARHGFVFYGQIIDSVPIVRALERHGYRRYDSGSFVIYAPPRRARPLKRIAAAARSARSSCLGPAVADGEHRSRPVRAAPKRPKDESGLPIDPDPLDPLEVVGHVHSLEHTGRSDEEPRHCPAHPSLGVERPGGTAERSVDREVVQRDARHLLDQLGVVPAAEAGCHLDDARTVRPDTNLHVGGPFGDAECGERPLRNGRLLPTPRDSATRVREQPRMRAVRRRRDP